MPAAACVGTVQMKVYFLPFLSVTVKDLLLFLASSGVFLPAILKSCLTESRFLTLKVTLPAGAEVFDSVNRKFLIVTVTVVAAVRFPPPQAATLKPGGAATARAAATGRLRFM